MQPEPLRIANEPRRRCALTLTTFQSFDAPWYKLTGALHNSPVLHEMDIGETNIKSMVTLRGFLPNGEALTSFASPCPPKWCSLVGRLFEISMKMKLEAETAGLPVPMAKREHHFDYLFGFDAFNFIYQDDEASCGARCVDEAMPLVQWGAGAAKGLNAFEHLEFTKGLCHPYQKDNSGSFDCDLRDAVLHECSEDLESLNVFRGECMDEMLYQSMILDNDRRLQNSLLPPETRSVTKLIHIPFAKWLLSKTCLDDDELTRDLGGFPLIGKMRATEYQSSPMTKVQKRVLSREEALDKRSLSNIEVIDRVK